MQGVVHIRKLPTHEALVVFPDLPREEATAPRECGPSRTGRHAPVDLSSLRYRPTPPFCAWCGAVLEADRSA